MTKIRISDVFEIELDIIQSPKKRGYRSETKMTGFLFFSITGTCQLPADRFDRIHRFQTSF
jgi:hypothetical protein